MIQSQMDDIASWTCDFTFHQISIVLRLPLLCPIDCLCFPGRDTNAIVRAVILQPEFRGHRHDIEICKRVILRFMIYGLTLHNFLIGKFEVA